MNSNRFTAGETIPITGVVKYADGSTFNGSGYSVSGAARDVNDLETVLFTWDGTIDASGNLDASIPAATTEDYPGKTVRVDVKVKSGPKQFIAVKAYLTLDKAMHE